MGFFEDDICWCGNSDDCDYTECFRHFSNRTTIGIFTFGYLKNTELCPLTQTEEDEEKGEN